MGTRDNVCSILACMARFITHRANDSYWRLGNYGPSTDAGLEGNGLFNVHSNGTFRAHVIFIGDNDSSGELRVC